MTHRILTALSVSVTLLAALTLSAPVAYADGYTGTVGFTGQVSFAAPIPGIALEDLEVEPTGSTEATGNGEKCEVNSTTGDNADVGGNYPSLGSVDANMTIQKGGGMNGQFPVGQCLMTIRARGTDGVSRSARGWQTVTVDVTDIQGNLTVAVSPFTVRESKAIAGVDKDCFYYVKKQIKARAKCNVLLLKKGAAAADSCKDFSTYEPLTGCDPGDFVEAITALSNGVNDQQLDPMNADDIDEVALKDQIICQKRFGKAAGNFAIKRVQLVQKNCVATNLDADSCRETQTNTAKVKLDQISKCVVNQVVDGGTGRPVPDVGTPCDTCIDGLGNIDTKCLRDCFQLTLVEMSDGIVGDVKDCGNGILQPGEFCDDGNTTPGDCCSEVCKVEMGTTEGPNGDPTCTDGLDNDCDGDIDGADPGCQ